MNGGSVCRAAALALAWMGIAGAAGAVDQPQDYAGSLALETRGGDALHRLELPVAVYAGIRHADLRDIRVFNAAQEPVPFALAGNAPPPPVSGAAFSPPVFAVPGDAGKPAEQLDVRIEQRADGSVVSVRTRGTAGRPAAPGPVAAWIVDASRIDAPVAALVPQWRTLPDNYLGSVRVDVSADLKDWRTLVVRAPLAYLAQGQARLVQDRVEFAPTRSKYFRLVFTPAAPGMTGVAFEAPTVRSEPRRLSHRVAGRPGANPGEFEFELGLRAPVDRVRLIVADANALAPARLESRPEARGEWRPVATTVAYRIVREGAEQVSPAVPVTPNASPHWRAVVSQAGGGLGATVPELEVTWPARNLVFLARGQGPFLLAFGRSEAPATQLPLPTLIPGYRDGDESGLPVAAAGAGRIPPPPAPSILPRVLGDADPKKLGLWAALLLGVLVLAGMAWRLARQMRPAPKGDGP